MNLDYVNNWSEKMNGSHKAMSKDEYSVTELLKDATAIVLKRRHYNAIPTDIQALADINAGDERELAERSGKSDQRR